MDIVFNGGRAEGTVSVPASKSYTHRAIMMAALSEGRCSVRNPLESFDTKATAEAMRSMGAVIEPIEGGLSVETSRLHAPDRTIDVLNSGTTMRLMTGLAALFDSETTITGDESIRRRPMGPLLKALEGCGARCASDGGRAPITIRGPVKGDRIVIDGSMSSQFVSSMLMMSPLVGRPMDVVIEGKQVSRPYIDVTISVMESFGVKVEKTEEGYHVEPQRYVPCDYAVPADFSSAAFPLVVGGLSGKVSVEGLDLKDPQGDKAILDILGRAGCEVSAVGGKVSCAKAERLVAADVDLSDIPDLFPIVAVLLSTAEGTSRLYGAPQLRFKESDRIASVERMLSALGADIRGTDDGCVIRGVPRLRGGRIEHGGDHRLMMAAAVASLVSDGPVSMEDDGCWNVSYPGFVEQMRSIGMRCRDVYGGQHAQDRPIREEPRRLHRMLRGRPSRGDGDRHGKDREGDGAPQAEGRHRHPSQGAGRGDPGGRRRGRQGRRSRPNKDNEHQQEVLVLQRVQRHSQAGACGPARPDEVQGFRRQRRSPVLGKDDRSTRRRRSNSVAVSRGQRHQGRRLHQEHRKRRRPSRALLRGDRRLQEVQDPCG